ncbi:MAG: ABC transporter ATP-binding protein [Nibricoccus sp.]
MKTYVRHDGAIDQRILSSESEFFVKKQSQTVLSVENLSVVRGSTRILNAVTWTVGCKQHWVILGPNGSGKTSLLRALIGYLTPSSGHIAVLGRVYGETDWRDLRERIGLVSSSLQISIPVAEPVIETVISGKFAQLDLWAKITRADTREAMRLLSLVGLSRLAERDWGCLSQGERQRVLIARALMAKPELLILDEPCAGLDPVAREHFLGFIERLARKRGCPSLVLVTHHVEEITPAFTHALLLRAGRVVIAGPRRTSLTSQSLGKTFAVAARLLSNRGHLRLALPRSLLSSRTL